MSALSSWRHARGELSLDRCLVMGILNRTPDSFFDGGRMALDASVDHALRMVEEGADVLDVGAVKAGPGAPVPEDEESDRLLPLIETLAERVDIPLSVETARPSIAARAFEAGAAILNDVSGLADRALLDSVAGADAGLIVMHHGGQIRGRPRHPRYANVTREVGDELTRLAQVAVEAGVRRDAIVLDPGLDFGKTAFHSLRLMRDLSSLVERGWPVLVAASRKDVVGETLDVPVAERLAGSLALVALAANAGAAIVRVHDVRESVHTVRMVEAVKGVRRPSHAVRGLWD